mmetsp:Transcript_31568/g.100168  ORF Transcript_31568/g.100168 Transcript_31568/m.100168 type:complete len:226 (-) Transcript_31568:101-778(-)
MPGVHAAATAAQPRRARRAEGERRRVARGGADDHRRRIHLGPRLRGPARALVQGAARGAEPRALQPCAAAEDRRRRGPRECRGRGLRPQAHGRRDEVRRGAHLWRRATRPARPRPRDGLGHPAPGAATRARRLPESGRRRRGRRGAGDGGRTGPLRGGGVRVGSHALPHARRTALGVRLQQPRPARPRRPRYPLLSGADHGWPARCRGCHADRGVGKRQRLRALA